jgi:long-subunit acyl-CoA synthetase (AMP-forming)
VIVSLDEAGQVAGEAPALALDGARGPRRVVPVSAADPAALASEWSRVAGAGDCPLVLAASLGEDQRRRVAAAAAGALPDVGHLLCTSGTTGAGGTPKVFFFPRDAALGNARAHLSSLGMRAGERVLATMPLAHSFGLVAAGIGSALLGAPLFAFRATPDPATLLAAAERFEATTLYRRSRGSSCVTRAGVRSPCRRCGG